MKKAILFLSLCMATLSVSARQGEVPKEVTSGVFQMVEMPLEILLQNNEVCGIEPLVFHLNTVALQSYCTVEMLDTGQPPTTLVVICYTIDQPGTFIEPIQLVYDYGGTNTTKSV